jgi:hypothetical protein
MDQLCSYLAEAYPGRFISCNESEAFLFLAKAQDKTLRICIHTIGADYSNIETDHSIVLRETKKSLTNISSSVESLGKSISRVANVMYIVVVYPQIIIENVPSHPLFGLKKIDGSVIVTEDNKLQKALLRRLGYPHDESTVKPVNRSTHDFFHMWSRENLPSGDNGVIKCDMDGCFVDPDSFLPRVLVEIKRSQHPPIPQWKPYPADYTGLSLLYNVANATDAELWILHHSSSPQETNLNVNNSLSLFKVNELPLPNWDEHNPLTVNELKAFIGQIY